MRSGLCERGAKDDVLAFAHRRMRSLNAIGHDFPQIQGVAPGGVPDESQSVLGAFADADPASHAPHDIQYICTSKPMYGVELATPGAKAALDAPVRVFRADIAGRGQHGRSVAMGVHGSAAACAAVAYGIETAEHDILEESVVYMAPVMLGLEDVQGLRPADPAGLVRVVFGNESGKRFADDQTDIQGQAGIIA